jgi:hypothetical protein
VDEKILQEATGETIPLYWYKYRVEQGDMVIIDEDTIYYT